MLLKIQMSKTLLLSFPKWGQLNFEHIAAMSSEALCDSYPVQPMDYIKDEYQNAARRQGGTMSGNHVSQAASISHTRVVLIDIYSTADEAPAKSTISVRVEYFDPQNAPFASVKIFYRPRGSLLGYFALFLRPF
jgi:hypothetical protein